MNPQWKVITIIYFIDGTMNILTCKDHDVEDVRMMIHECRWKHHLPSDQPDQIQQVVTQSRSVWEGKEFLYYTKWKMM